MANEMSDYDVIPYIPCHFDHAQVEYIMPFLTQWGGKVFIYPSHGEKDKFLKFFNSLPNVEAYIFTLENIIQCILKETKKVVWIRTGSTAYSWGQYQSKALSAFITAWPEKVVDQFQLGHCMYGCFSCAGNEHNIPIYFTRYFNKSLPYRAADLRKKFCKDGVKNVIVCPSTADVSMLLQPTILDLLLKLEHEGNYRFIWKFHPSAFSDGYFDLNEPLEKKEHDSIVSIRQNFVTVPEDFACLLPFFELFDLVLCDLHSSVPFIASYFCPKVILAYENDTGYEGVQREDKYLSLLNRFQSADELQKLLETLPEPKGDASFFFSKYGKVDGREHYRIAGLRKWPTVQAATTNGVSGSPPPVTSVKDTEFFKKVDAVWKQLQQEFPNDDDLLDSLGLWMPPPRHVPSAEQK